MFVSDLKSKDYEVFRRHIERIGARDAQSASYDYPISFNKKEYLLRLQFTHKVNVVALQAYSISSNKLITDNRILSAMLEFLMFEVVHEPNEEKRSCIFGDYEGFIGSRNPSDVLPDIKMWVATAQSIRFKLKEKAYLLDEYLWLLFAGFDKNPIDNIIFEASEAANSLLLSCNHILQGDEKGGSKYNALVQKIVEENPLACQEMGTKTSYYFSVLLDKAFRSSYDDFFNGAKPNPPNFDIVRIRELYRNLEELLSEDCFLICQLNRELKGYFTVITPMQIYAKHFTESLLGAMTSNDMESGKYIFQLILANYSKEGSHV